MQHNCAAATTGSARPSETVTSPTNSTDAVSDRLATNSHRGDQVRLPPGHLGTIWGPHVMHTTGRTACHYTKRSPSLTGLTSANG